MFHAFSSGLNMQEFFSALASMEKPAGCPAGFMEWPQLPARLRGVRALPVTV